MQNIVPEMQDLPFFHKGIECFCPKFVLFEDQWIGTVLTPWMMSVVILPGPQQQWEPRELGDKLTHYNYHTKHLLSLLVVLKMYRNI